MNGTDTNGGGALAVEKLVYGGEGLARRNGRVVLVPFVLPGEVVEVEIQRERHGVLQARLRQVLEPAAGRSDPPCPFFFRCGGCHYQHAASDLQLELKQAILRDVLRRVGKLDAPADIPVVAGEPWGYRNRTQFHLANGEIGYFGFGTHRLVPVDRCPISSPKINAVLAALRDMLNDRRFPRFLQSLEVFTNETDVQLNVIETGQPLSKRFFEWAAERVEGLAGDAIDYPAGGRLFRVRHRSFFQVNRFLTDAMVQAVLAGADGSTALDLYSGVGLFSLPLAERFQEVTAVESSGSAVADLEFNAARAGLSIQARHQPVEVFIGGLQQPPNFVLADPPRAGLGPLVVRHLLRLKPPRLTIVSCDPATLARDLAPLLQGGYRLDRLTLVELFPQTFHLEAIAHLCI